MVNQRRAGALLSYLYIAVNSLIVLVYIPLAERRLGQSEFGLYSLVASIINYMSVMDLGFGNGIVVYTAKYHAAGKYEEEKKLHSMFAVIFCGIGIIAALLGLVLTLNAEFIFGASMTAGEIAKAKILLLILTVNMGLTFPLSMYGNIIIANEKFIFSKLVTIFRALLNPLIMIPLLLYGADSIAMISVLCGVNILCLVSNKIFCSKKLGIRVKLSLPKIGEKISKKTGKMKKALVFPFFDGAIFREIFSYSLFIFIAEIVDKVNWCVDKIVLGIVNGTAEVTVYSMAANYNEMVLQLSAVLSGVMLPKISKMVARKEGDDALNREFIKTSRLQFFMIYLVSTGFVILGHKFVIWHAGADCETSYYVALLLILSSAIPITQSVAISIIKAKNLFRFRAMIISVMALLNIGISIPFAYYYGSVGSAAGTAIALVVANIIIINIYYQKRCGIDIAGYWRDILTMTVKFIPVTGLVLVLKLLFPVPGIWELLLYGSVYVIMFCIYSYFAVMNTYERELADKYIGKVLSVFGKNPKKS